MEWDRCVSIRWYVAADDYPHLLNMTFSGSDLLSGGECKIEGSIVVLVVNAILLAVLIGLQRKK